MINIFKKLFHFIRSNIQNRYSSYIKHDSQYNDENSLEKHKIIYKKYHQDDILNNAFNKVDYFLKKNYHLTSIAIDIGCGGGWASSLLSKKFKKVIGIEPSKNALYIAQEIYAKEEYPNIDWVNDFAENRIQQLQFDVPIFFFSGCVMSHLKDTSVVKICKKISDISVSGSGFSLCENWGNEHHDYMWHVRTKDWWQEQFPEWSIDFHGPNIEGKTDRFQGMHGIKK